MLIGWPEFDLTAVGRLREIDHSNIDDLLFILENLLDQIPPGIIVFCILDAITVLEDRKLWKDSAAKVIRALVQITEKHDAERHCLLKLLLTSPTGSRSLYREVPGESVVWMPEIVPRNGAISDYVWKRDVARNLEVPDRNVLKFGRGHGSEDLE